MSRWTRLFWTVLAVTTAWKCFAATHLDVCFDEGYYHFWSLNPQWSYFDHPPLVAWAMWLVGGIFGDSSWSVRFWPVVSGVLFALVGRALARRIFDADTGDRSGCLLALAPVFAGNGLLMTPDTLFALCWAVALYGTWRAISCSGTFSPWWFLVGGAAGLGFLSKYNMILFFIGLGVLWLVLPGRRLCIFLGGAVAGVMALILFLPVILWNSSHEWISFQFQLSHGFGKNPRSIWQNMGDYLGALLAIVTPVLGVLSFRGSVRFEGWGDMRRKFLAVFFWVVVLFFGYSALKTRVQANWPMMAFFSGLILVAQDWPRLAKGWRWSALVLLLGADVVAMTYLSLPGDLALLAGDRSLDPPRMKEFVGAPEVARAVRQKIAEAHPGFVCAHPHQLFGTLSFYTPELRSRLWLPPRGRLRFPWIDDRAWSGQTALLVSYSERDWNRDGCFSQVRLLGTVDIPFKKVLKRTIYFYEGRDYNPAAVPSIKEQLKDM